MIIKTLETAGKNIDKYINALNEIFIKDFAFITTSYCHFSLSALRELVEAFRGSGFYIRTRILKISRFAQQWKTSMSSGKLSLK